MTQDIENAGNVPAEPIKDTIEVVSSTETPEPDGNAAVESEKPQAKASEESKSSRNQRRRLEKEALIRENAATLERNKTLEAELSKYKQPKEAEQPKADSEPNIADYADVFDYNKALIKWEATQNFKTLTENQRAEQEKEQVNRAYQAKEQAYVERLRPVLEAKPELADKLEQYEQQGLISKHLESAVIDSDIGEKITEYLADRPDALAALSRMNEAQTYKAIGILEAQLYTNPEKQERPKVTQAQPPIRPPGNTAKTDRSINSYTQEEIENMPLSEYKKITNMK